MMTAEFEFEAFLDNFDLAADEPSDLPSLTVEFVYRTHPAEPDVGIFGEQVEVTGITYFLDSEKFVDEDAFADAIYARISEEIEDTREAVAKVVRDQVDEWEGELNND